MKLYEVNQQLEDLILQLEPDPETGEIPANEDEIIARIRELALKREDILKYLAKLYETVRNCCTKVYEVLYEVHFQGS